MKKILYISLLFVGCLTTEAQINTEVEHVQNYIQTTSQTEWFDPINKTGVLENGSQYDLSYYVLPDNTLFSIIYTVFDKATLRKSFYFKNNQLIACIVEETDTNNANKILKYADYFIKDNVLINKEDENKYFPSTNIINEGLEKINTFNN